MVGSPNNNGDLGTEVGSAEWNKLAAEGWVFSAEEMANLDQVIAQGLATQLTPTQEEQVNSAREAVGLGPVVVRRQEEVGTTRIRGINISDDAYAALKVLAREFGQTRAGGNVSALLELIGQGKLKVYKP